AQAILDHIATPLGRLDYHYDTGERQASIVPTRLTGMTRPDGMHKAYLYEADKQAGNPQALTGITLADKQRRTTVRLNTWAYDRQGRATLSIAGSPGSSSGKVRIDYRRPPSARQTGLT